MVLRIQLENGPIRQYDTWYTTGGGESGPETYETTCGMKLYKKPERSDECSHIDCAIGVIEHSIAVNKFISVMIFAAAVFASFAASGQGDTDLILIIGALGIPFALLFAVAGFASSREKQELLEFRDSGTINGIKADQIP